MTSFLQDLKYALRGLGRSPGFTAAALLTLAFGIGANVAIFSLVDEIWLRPMPVPQPGQLMRIFTSNPGSEGVVARGNSSYLDFLSLRETVKTLSGVALLERRGVLLDTGSENKLVTAAVVSDNFFDVLRPVPALGRTFTEREVEAPGARAVMFSYPFWRQQFNGNPGLVGKTVLLDRQQVLVAGILPRGFRGTEPLATLDVWIPVETWIELTGERGRLAVRGMRDYDLFARLRPGSSLEQANAELAAIAARLAREFPKSNAGRRMSVVPETRARGGAAARLSTALLAVAGLVLLIACANVASVLLARAEYRRHELATRVALGASRFRLSRQMLAEAALLAAFAAIAAIAVGGYLVAVLPKLLPESGFSAQLDVHMSGRVLVFAALAAVGSLAIFGLIPAWQASSTAPVDALKERASAGGGPRARMRSALVVLQVALSLVLAVSGELLVRSLVNAENSDPGFNAHQNMLVLELVPGFGVRGPGADRAFVEEARRRLEALPGVGGTAAGMRIPFGLSGSGATRKVFLPEAGYVEEQNGIPIQYDPVSDRFFELMGTRLLRGRAIDAHDLETHAHVMVVNQTMARRFWPGRDPIGRRLRLDKPDGDLYEVIGVAENSINADFAEDPAPYLYTPMSEDDYSELTLIVQTRTKAASLAGTVRNTLRDLNRNVPVIYMATLREHMRQATSEQRMATGLIVSLGTLGLFLLAVGLYALTAYLAGRRAREIGIRLALGAERRAIFDLVIGGALLLTGIGVVLGAVAALAMAQVLRSFLFGVSPVDPLAFLMGILTLAVVTCAAAFAPAWRAMKVDPVTILRAE